MSRFAHNYSQASLGPGQFIVVRPTEPDKIYFDIVSAAIFVPAVFCSFSRRGCFFGSGGLLAIILYNEELA